MKQRGYNLNRVLGLNLYLSAYLLACVSFVERLSEI